MNKIMKKLFKKLIIPFLIFPVLADAGTVPSYPSATTIQQQDLFYLVTYPYNSLSDHKLTWQVLEQQMYASFSGNITVNSAGSVLINNGAIVNNMLATGIDPLKINPSTVSSTVFNYLANVTSDIQTQINAISSSITAILSTPNTWTALQTFGNNISFGGITANFSSVISGQVITYNGTNWVNSTISSAPAGSDTQIQINQSSSFGASANLTYSATGLTVGGSSCPQFQTGNGGTFISQLGDINNCVGGDILTADNTSGFTGAKTHEFIIYDPSGSTKYLDINTQSGSSTFGNATYNYRVNPFTGSNAINGTTININGSTSVNINGTGGDTIAQFLGVSGATDNLTITNGTSKVTIGTNSDALHLAPGTGSVFVDAQLNTQLIELVNGAGQGGLHVDTSNNGSVFLLPDLATIITDYLISRTSTDTITNKSIDGSEINSGTVAATYLPTATGAALGVAQAGVGITASAGVFNSNAVWQANFQPGLLTSVVGSTSVFGKVGKASTVDNIIGSALIFSCISNPTVTMYECGISTTCTSPTTIGSVTVTTTGTAVVGTISAASITAGDYIGWALTAGTCTSLDISVTAQIHSN